MAFDFNDSSRSSGRRSSGSRGFPDFDQSGDSSNPFDDFDEPAGGGTGFRNKPSRRSRPSQDTDMVPFGDDSRTPGSRVPSRRTSTRRRSGVSLPDIPWRTLMPLIGIILAVVLCVIYRDAITSFLAQVLSWLITIGIIILLFKWLIFGGKRR